MDLLQQGRSLADALQIRRERLAQVFTAPALLWSGQPTSRNFPANQYPFRASSHFLYFAGLPLSNAVIHLDQGRLTLFLEEASSEDAIWHGETPTRGAIAEAIGAKAHYPLSDLSQFTSDVATLPVQDAATRGHQQQLLQRSFLAQPPHSEWHELDLALAHAIISLRLSHDTGAIAQLRQAASVTIAAHRAGMTATSTASTEAVVRAAMEQVIMSQNMICAYPSIVTKYGEVLHNVHYHHPLQSGDLILADVGAETTGGWAADVTRTWPVSGEFTSLQQNLYEVVLAAHDSCIKKIRPGTEFRHLHLMAASILTQGLVDLGLLRGNVSDLVEQDAHVLFFPHGIGHLLGLDVHDMEDLGDLAGYEVGRTRSDRFGLRFLRLDRPLKPGMLVTIEPGFYCIPSLLNHPTWREKYRYMVNWERLSDVMAVVRGIRIEDDILVTATGYEVLTKALPTQVSEIEALCQNGTG